MKDLPQCVDVGIDEEPAIHLERRVLAEVECRPGELIAAGQNVRDVMLREKPCDQTGLLLLFAWEKPDCHDSPAPLPAQLLSTNACKPKVYLMCATVNRDYSLRWEIVQSATVEDAE